ncbi:MAG: type I polyketide synthase [Lutisporaceae bacterium]
MENIKNYIIKQLASNKLSQDEAKKMLLELKAKPVKTEEGIAIIGMACKFPGAKNLEEYWNNMIDEVNCIKDYPESRKKDLYEVLSNPIFRNMMYDLEIDDEKNWTEKLEFAKNGYLEDVDKFDAGYFNIPPREAKFIDPLHRLLLETAMEAIEDGGYGGRKIYGTKTGVYIGRDNAAYSNYSMITENDPMQLTGSYASMLATRLSYIYDFKGPGMVIDTACSSGAVAIHQACKALKSSECDYALAGGVNFISLPKVKGHSNMELIESSDSKVRTFDRNANGTVWGEGIGVLLLKKMSKAIEDNDNIYAVIKGSAINNDGASNGITAPNAEAQEDVIVQAWKAAGINPETVYYIESHGTGTVLGDPIEIKGLENAFRRFTDRKQFCGIGSVKPSVGHLVSASGLASVIKVVLSLKNGMIPASMNFEEPNPFINFCDSPVYVNDKLRVWNKSETPRRAGVSSFGFSGTNCHIVIEEVPELERTEVVKALQVLTISARKESNLFEYANRIYSYLCKETEYDLCDLCCTANTGRNHFEYRIAIIADSIDELKRKLMLVKGSNTFENPMESGIFYGSHYIVSNNKKILSLGDITEEQKNKLSIKASELVHTIHNSSIQDNNSLEELCKLYAEGAEVEWDNFYSGKSYKRVSLPTYPFERTRFWAATKQIKLEYGKKAEGLLTKLHPLFDNQGIASMDRYTFTTSFSANKHWILNEHKLKGNYVVPGTTYLEMAIEASKSYYKGQNTELRDVLFLTPLVVGDEGKEVQTIIKKEEDHLEFIIASSTVGADNSDTLQWTVYAEGKVYIIADKANEQYSIDTLKNTCSKYQVEYDVNGKNERGLNGPFEFGDRWNNISRIFTGADEAVIFLSLPDKLSNDVENYYMHPALMDNAVNSLSQSIAEGIYLPLSYKSIKIYDRLPNRFYSYLKRKELKNDNLETIVFDIKLLTEDGDLIADISEYVIKKMHREELYYDVVWNEIKMKEQPVEAESGSVLIFKDEKGVSDFILDKLRRTGRNILEVEQGEKYEELGSGKYTINGTEEDYQKLLVDIKKQVKITNIIHLMTIVQDNVIKSIDELEQAKSKGLYSLFRLIKALMLNGYTHEIKLVLVTEYANRVTPEDKMVYPHSAAAWGLGRVISQEYPNIKLACIDIDEVTDLKSIFPEFLSNRPSYGIAYRNGKRYEPCLITRNISEGKDKEMKLREEGVYIITGGMGGIGIEIAKHLSSKSKINLALVNRSKMPDAVEWEDILRNSKDKKLCNRIKAVKEVQNNGSNVNCYSLDISNEKEVQQLIARLKADFGKINGVIHGAGIAGDGFLIQKDESIFKQVIAPKINGTWLLNEATREEELEFFIVFSSTATLVPSAGQGDYTAANSYLDAFAEYRNIEGKKTLSINWPAWNETGMAFEHGKVDTNMLFKAISTKDALDIFDSLICSKATRAYVGELNYKAVSSLKGEIPILISESIKKEIEKYASFNLQEKTNTDKYNKDIIIKGIEKDKLSVTQDKIARIWAQVFDVNEIDIYNDFFDMGGDSILAAQLIKDIDKSYPDTIGISDIFSSPSVIEISYLIDERTVQTTIKENEEDDALSMFDNLLDSIETGELSIAEGISLIKDKRSGEDE